MKNTVISFILSVLFMFCLPSFSIATEYSRTEALADPDMPLAYQRALSLPGCQFFESPNGRSGDSPPIFSILYIYERWSSGGKVWLKVGMGPLSGPVGWVRSADTEQWKHALVLQFARRGVNREPALFFKDSRSVIDLATSVSGRTRAEVLLRAYRGHGTAPNISWVEPEARYSSIEKPYLLPIIEAMPVALGLGDDAVVARVASVNATRQETPHQEIPQSPHVDMSGMRTGLVFVVDTSMSMQPYIQRVQELIRRVYTTVERRGLLKNISFGLIGFRAAHNTKHGLEYTTYPFQNLDPNALPNSILPRVDAMREASVSTPVWQEDAYAGLSDALRNMNWDPFKARLVVLVTDAGPLTGGSPWVRDPSINTRVIREMANDRDVAIFPVHLVTEEALRHDHLSAANEYRMLGATGDETVNKYMRVDAGSPEVFRRDIDMIADALIVAADLHKRGQQISKADVQQATGPTSMVFNEIFRAQFEYLASAGTGVVPRYDPSWTVDVDLTNPPVRTMEPYIFLTRSQLNGLAQATKEVLNRAKTSSMRASEFYDQVTNISAGTSTGGGSKAPGVFDDIIGAGFLPTLLSALPYRSQVLSTKRDVWMNQSATQRQQFIDELERKLAVYEAKDGDNKAWMDLGGGDRRDGKLIGESTLLPLRELP
jgi:serine/threonine-protein kinase PpkA